MAKCDYCNKEIPEGEDWIVRDNNEGENDGTAIIEFFANFSLPLKPGDHPIWLHKECLEPALEKIGVF